ncbi:T9SS type B sorting domain-containing protein [Muriicola sp.]|uniref:T9SS type B sorting domain-containing protein n=1 Tax=Muriicola sp. TaxID=2020856 RepID=UPI003C706FCB
MRPNFTQKVLAACLVLFSYVGYSQEFNNFEIRYQNNLKGDLTFIANNIVNRDGGTGNTEPEDPYNTTGNSSTYNDWLNQQYIDIDSDPTTFSSSSATFAFPNASCNLIRYAGLYWSATYPSEQAGQAVGTNRQNDFNQVKFMVPGGAYIDIVADEVLYDGFTSGDPSVTQNSPYACYADVTALITPLADPTGDYTIANVRSVVGSLSPGGGAAAGWTLVIVYENPTLTGKLITTFDGFARVRSANPTVDINYAGFNTIPAGPVRANIGAAALEGDNRITGDRMQISSATVPGFTNISNGVNPANNFFNSNITLNGAITTNRNPNSVNTLGYDTDMFLLNNPGNSVIPNSETAATLRFTSSGDQYYPFFNSFNIEIIEPNIIVEKKVEDIAGNDITGMGVNLGQLLDYVLSFENIGNDDATNYVLRDILPVNVTIDESNLVMPAGVTYVYDPISHEISFFIPDNIVEEGDPTREIRMRVRVAENCFDFVDACTDQIPNQAYSTYQGVINNNVITDDPSVSDFDNCGFVTPGATNFLLDDLESCDYSRTVQLCGEDVLLDAGDNFDSYVWYRDENMDGLIDAGDTIIDDGDPDGDPSTQLVTDLGIYIVDKIIADPCKGFQEIITVEPFGLTQTNPIIDLINDTSNTVEGEIVTCPNDGELLPKIFLCGLNDTELITINIPDADSIDWEQLDTASCSSAGADCANKNSGCAWNNVGTGNSFLASDPGEYRLIINYQNGCFTRFYFNIFKNPLDPQYNSRDLICAAPGNITVTNMPADYEYQLLDATNGNILVPYSANNGPSFTIGSNGAYTVEMRQVGVTDGCIFRLENIGILTRDFQLDITTKDTDCNGLGEISISALDVEPQYYYEISQGGTIVDTYGPTNDNNYTFQNLNDGIYDVRVTTDDGCDLTEQVTINDVTDLAAIATTTKPIDCIDGIITVTGSGGFPNPEYLYAIWSYNGVTPYTDITDIPPAEFQVENDFSFTNGEEGDYVFIVVDANNCWELSNVATITVEPAVDYTITPVDELCFGAADGSVSVNIINSNGYTLSYTLTYPDSSTASNGSGNFTGLGQGNYSLTLTQTNGTDICDFIETFSISGPVDSVTATAVLIQPYTCLQDATIEAQGATGGNAPYEYSIDGVTFFSGAGAETFVGLTDGSYTITVRDANGCLFVTNTVVVAPLNPPTDISFAATPPNCPAQTADVTLTVAGGTGAITYDIIAPAVVNNGASNLFTGLSPDTYTFRVTDANGCVYEENYTIAPVIPINAIGQLVSNISCFGDTDGEALFTISGFVTSYDYSVTGPASFSGVAETSATISLMGLAVGTYDITVTDTDTNCTDTASVTINGPAAALALLANETQPTCTADGTVSLVASNGWGGYNYSITFPDLVTIVTNTSGNFTGLDQFGTYTASVTDANGCIITTTFDLNAAVAPVLAITPNAFCYDDATGLTLTANVTSGGDGNYQYRLNGGTYGTNNVFAGLSAGTFTIDVIDGNNCTDTATITINPELSVTAAAGNITSCGTATDVTVTAAGGDGSYVFAIVADGVSPIPGDFGVINPITVTGGGDYDVYVRDNNGGVGYCEATYDLTIAQDPPITITPTSTPVVCFGESNGTISITAAGGMGPYQYSIDNGANYQPSGNFVNVAAGTYTIRVRDANNCEETSSIIVSEPAPITAEAVQTQAYTCLQLGEITVGSITPTTGGSGDYQYSLNGGVWTAATTGGAVFSGLIDGAYSIRVRDANASSCSITLPDVIIAPLPVEPNVTTTLTYNCDGTGNITILPNDPSYMYILDGGVPQASNVFYNVIVGGHTITVDYGSDCTVDAPVFINSGNAFDASVTNFTNISCNGGADGSITFSITNFDTINGFEYSVNGGGYSAPQTSSPIVVNGLSAGINTIDVRDVLNNSCLIALSETLTEPTPVVASASITAPFTCSNLGATITASATGGTPTYLYQLEDTVGGIIRPYQASTTFASVPAGDYIVRARDINNCDDPIDAPISVLPPVNPTFTTTPTLCYSGANDASIQADITSLPGNGGFQFSLNGGPWITPSPATATTYTFTNLATGTYTIDVRDQFGCTGVQQSITINPQLTAIIDVVDLSTCADGSITVTASGGDGSYEYAFVPTTTSPTGLFTPANTFAVTAGNAGDYDVYVRDNSAVVPYCEYVETVTVNPAIPLVFTTTANDPECHDGAGSIDVNITSGVGPYTLQIIDLDNGGASDETNNNVVNPVKTYYNLMPGDYTVIVTDVNGCIVTDTPITITNPDELTADIVPILPAACGSLDPNDYGFQFINYPATLGLIEFSADGGLTWTGDNSIPGTTDILTGYFSGTSVYPSLRTTDGLGNTVCQVDLPRYIIPFPLDDLDISISTIVVNCNELQVTVQGTEGVPNYEYAYTDDPASFNPATAGWTAALPGSYTWIGLIPGKTYVFYVRDSTGCIRQSNVNVNDITTNPIEIDATYEPSCFGANDAEITYTLTDTDGNIEPNMRWELYDVPSGGIVQSSGGNIPYSPTIVVNGLGPGEYYIVVTEVTGGGADNCTSGSENILIEELDAITATVNVIQNISCNSPGLIQVTNILGGGGQFTYDVTGPAPFVPIVGTTDNPIEIATGSPAGNYTVTIQDQFGCGQSYVVPVTLDPSPEILLTLVPNCAVEGAFEVMVTLDQAGIGPYALSVNGGPFQNIVFNGSNEYTITNLSSGAGQTVEIMDLNGCGETEIITIYPPLQFTAIQTELLDCDTPPNNNAEITINVISGSGFYEYEIVGPINQGRIPLPSNPYVWTGASANGVYSVIVYDVGTPVPNCQRTIDVDAPAAIVPVYTEIHTDVTCNGADDGTITLTAVDNGITPLTYTISPIAGSFNAATNTFENLPPDTYSITATGANNCITILANIIINEPAVLVIPAPTIVEFACVAGNTTSNASITINSAAITGGSGTYVVYEFVNDQGTPAPGDDVVVQTGPNVTYIETNTAGGSYTINVYDTNGCVGTASAVIVPFDQLLTATAAITNPISCNPGMDGEITITATSIINNPANFEYSINNGVSYQASNIFSGLDAGVYNFLIRNINTGCVISASETLANPNTFTIDVVKTSDVICYGTATGEVTFELVDATYPGDFDWEIWDTNGTPSNLADDISVATGSEVGNGPTPVINIVAGNYYVSITQTNFPFCTNTEPFYILGPNAAITGNADVTPISCLGNDGIIEITDALGGWGGYSYYVGLVPPTGAGDYVVSPRFENLAAGTYEAWVIDANGCQQMIQNNLVLADPALITASLQINQENCVNLQGEIEVIGTAGGQGSNYTYQLIKDGAAFGAPQTTTVFSGLGAGSYQVQITDQWSCSALVGPEVLYEEMNLVSAVVKPLDCTVNPDGEITIAVSGGSANLDFTVTYPDLVTTVSNNTGVFVGLDQVGTYTFVVTDLDTTNPVCVKNISEVLVAPTPVTFDTHTIVDVSCFGMSDGTVTVNLSASAPGVNDNPIYTYNLYSAAVLYAGPQTDPVFSGLPSGTYEVEAISSKGCSLRETVVVGEPPLLTVSATATVFYCNPNNTVNTSTITATVPVGAGTSPYLYSIDNVNYQTANTFDIVDNGSTQNITVYVLDANGCATSTAVVIDPLNVFSAAVSRVSAISCANPEQVLITVSDDGDPLNAYTFELLPLGNPNGSLTGTPTNVTAEFDLTTVGSYTFRITDTVTGCYIDTAPYIIAPYDLIDVVAIATTPVVCYGDSNGAIEIDVTGYSGTYNYEIFTSASVSTGITGGGDTAVNPLTINGLPGGNYFVRITETALPLCVEDSNIITIVSPSSALVATVNQVANVTCTNDQGEILVDPSGGYAPYDIVLTNTTTSQVYTVSGVNSQTFTGLSAGNFTIDITDAGGCILSDTETLVQPAPITADITATPTTLVCYGDTNATITAINVLGGQGVYQYRLNYYDPTGAVIDFSSGGQSGPVFNNIGAGIYSITVSDGWNCGVETIQVTIAEPSDVESSLIQISPLTCTNDAQITLMATGGTAPYEYSTDNIVFSPMSGGNTHTFTVVAGVYQYYVRDSFGCEASISNQVSIDPVPPLTIGLDLSAAMINCMGEATATIIADATGGLGNYSYELFSDAALTNLLVGPQPNGDFSGLIAGSYYIRVVSVDCVEVTNEIIITEPLPLQIDRQEFTNVTCAGEGDGTITVEVSGGTGNILYAITPNLNQFDTINTFDRLAPGVYDVIAQDVNGCFIPFQFTITEPAPVTATYIAEPEICAGSEDGTITVSISGGTAPYRTALNTTVDTAFVQDQFFYSDLAAGTYVVFIRDAQDCEANVIVVIDPGVNLNGIVEPVYECTGAVPDNYLNITMEDPTVLGSIMYALDSTDPADMQLNPDFTNTAPGPHYIAISHANGCVQTIDFEIENFEPLTLILEQNNINEITAVATGGLEDYTFIFDGEDNGTDNTYYINRTDTFTVQVIDANGCMVEAQIAMEFIDIELPNFFTPDGDGMNDAWIPRNMEGFPEILTIVFDRYGRELYRITLNSPGWNGMYQGSMLPTGDYWYVVKLNGERDDREFVGHFTLYR